MPVLSKFYGVVIRMLFIRSSAPQFSAIYGNEEMVVGIRPLKIIQGDIPAALQQIVLTWAVQHQRELLEAWQRCQTRQVPAVIAPVAEGVLVG